MEFKDKPSFLKFALDCRKNGIQSIKMNANDVTEIHFSDAALFPESTYKKKKAEETTANAKDVYSNSIVEQEAALFWSSPSVPSEEMQ